MKKIKFLFASLLMFMCVNSINAQSITDILGGVAKTVVGNKATTESSIKGTWVYSKPACEFESENLLAKAGGTAAATKVETKLTPLYKTLGITNVSFKFDGKGNYTAKLKKREMKGTYTFNKEKKTLTLKPGKAKEVTVYVNTLGSKMTLTFNADKLMSGMKAITNMASTKSTTSSAVNSLLGNYNGMRLGIELKK